MRIRALAVFLGLWSFGFACIHVAWALGWRWGVPSDAPPITERPWFLAYDVLAALLMYAAALVALLLARGGLPKRTRDLLTNATLVGAALALMRGVPALIIDLATGSHQGVGFGADVWFTVAGIGGLALATAAPVGPVRSAAAGRRMPALGPRPPAGGGS